MCRQKDGPASPLFSPLTVKGNVRLNELANRGISEEMAAAIEHAPVVGCQTVIVAGALGTLVGVEFGGELRADDVRSSSSTCGLLGVGGMS